MIDWNAVGRNGFVVKLPTGEAVDTFLEELHRELPQLSPPSKIATSSIKVLGDDAAMYVGCNGLRDTIHWEWSGYSFFQTAYPYNKSEFFDYGLKCQDFGDLGCEYEIDVCSLFSAEEVPL